MSRLHPLFQEIVEAHGAPPPALTVDDIKERYPRWEYVRFEYGRWTATHENYDASWEGEEDGYVGNGWFAEGRTLENLAEDIESVEAEHAAESGDAQ
jgi:hypothetical protein